MAGHVAQRQRDLAALGVAGGGDGLSRVPALGRVVAEWLGVVAGAVNRAPEPRLAGRRLQRLLRRLRRRLRVWRAGRGCGRAVGAVERDECGRHELVGHLRSVHTCGGVWRGKERGAAASVGRDRANDLQVGDQDKEKGADVERNM